MKGDFSRVTFKPARHYSAVLMQQGRAQLDADWNEEAAIRGRELRLLARDLIGPCGGPTAHAGFEIKVDASGRQITIGAGRYYVGGLLSENEQDCAFERQPDLPSARGMWRAADARPGACLIYLDVWEREITSLDDPALREPALGGPDTSVRLKLVWQVRLGAIDGPAMEAAAGEAESPGTLNLVTAQPGYRGPENHLYRVEIHEPGTIEEATFKWSRDNGSVAAAIEKVDAYTLTLAAPWMPGGRRFTANQWVEISDDARELDGKPGELCQIATVDEGRRTVTLSEIPRLLASHESGADLHAHPKVRGWDHAGGQSRGQRLSSDPQPLEHGIEVQFSPGTFRTGDYWLIPARTADASVEWPGGEYPEAQPPRSIAHYRCPLAEIDFDPKRHAWWVRDDRRRLFAPLASSRVEVPSPPR